MKSTVIDVQHLTWRFGDEIKLKKKFVCLAFNLKRMHALIVA